MSKKIVYFPGLNGIRAIAALAVVVSHVTISLKNFNLDPGIFGTVINGKIHGLALAGYGVTIFFVLSGFLITYLLLTEKIEQKSIDIKKFYIRRILRIWPLYYLYLGIAITVILLRGQNLDTGSLLLYIFYAANVPFILGTALPHLDHYWSLGVEEQFYLFWPWICSKVGSLLLFCFIAFTVLLGTKVALHFFAPNMLLEEVLNVTRFHCMILGAIGAILYNKGNRLFLLLADNKITQIICWVILFLVAINKYHVASVIDAEIVAVVALLLIIGQISVHNRIINLEVGVLDFLGKISYGLYVMHPLIILGLSVVLKNISVEATTKYVIVYSSVLAGTIFVSYLSYTYFEKYFLGLKKKFEVVKSLPNKKQAIAGLAQSNQRMVLE